MNEFSINYKKSKTAQVAGILIGTYLTVFCLYFVIVEVMGSRFSTLFYCSLVGAILSSVILLKNTLLQSKDLVRIDSNTIEVNMPSQEVIAIDWADVSEVSLGVSYLVLLLNGKKQKNIDLSTLAYNDMKNTKSKIVELCEHKSIPYKND